MTFLFHYMDASNLLLFFQVFDMLRKCEVTELLRYGMYLQVAATIMNFFRYQFFRRLSWWFNFGILLFVIFVHIFIG